MARAAGPGLNAIIMMKPGKGEVQPFSQSFCLTLPCKLLYRFEQSGRKVRATQSIVLPNRKALKQSSVLQG